ncbi:MAG: hypothetical protein ACR2MY_14845 [Candidatus Dormibacteria bacterium]
MAENPTTEGPVKSLRQAAPAGDIVAAVFALIALLIVVGMIRTPPSALGFMVSLVFFVIFALPAYVLYGSSRSTGMFVTGERVEYRLLGRPRVGWNRAEVGAIEAMGGGLRVLDPEGRVLRTFKFRWWNTEQVARFASSAGLARAQRGAAASAPEVQPGEPGNG